MSVFSELAKYYDAIYYKAAIYETESQKVSSLIEKYIRTRNRKLLDLARGTGTHIKFFLGEYQVSGLDLAPEMLDIAKERYPHVRFYSQNMIDFEIDDIFGAVICLYGSIGLVQTTPNLHQALRSFAKHMDNGGVLILTPWSNKADFKEHVVSDIARKENVQVVRMEKVARLSEDTVDITYHYLIGENQQVSYFKGHHPPVGLFSLKEYEQGIMQAGFEITELYRGKEIQMGMAYVCRKIAGYSD